MINIEAISLNGIARATYIYISDDKVFTTNYQTNQLVVNAANGSVLWTFGGHGRTF